jgi:hypothetical protein
VPTTTPVPTTQMPTTTSVPATTQMPTTTSVPATTSLGIIGVSTNPDNIIVAGSENNEMAYSYDGINWNLSSAPAGARICYDVAWNGKLWVAVGSAITYSTDGITWTTAKYTTVNNGDRFFTVAWNGSMWLARGNTGYTFYSTDGITWKFVYRDTTPLFSQGCQIIRCNGTLCIAGGRGLNQMAYAYDGLTWNKSPSGSSPSLGTEYTGVAWNGSLWVAVGSELAYSYDGINWTKVTKPFTSYGTDLYAVAWNGSLWVAGGGVFIYSYDGIKWTASPTTLSININGITWNRSLWIAVGEGEGTINAAYSSDGINWTASNTSSTNIFHGVASKIVLPYTTNTVAQTTKPITVGGNRTRKYPYLKKKRSSRKKRYLKKK